MGYQLECLIAGLGWWFEILGVPLSNNPFHKGILGIQKPPGPKPTITH